MNLWKVAAAGQGAPENVPKTLSQKIGEEQRSKLPEMYRHFDYAWGSQESQYKVLETVPDGYNGRGKDSTQSIMRKGDICLFYTKDVTSQAKRSAFYWIAQIRSEPFFDAEVSQALWGTPKFPVVYELSEPQQILLLPEELGEILDPNGGMHRRFPQGLMAVQTKIIEDNYEVTTEEAIPLVLDLICRRSGSKAPTFAGGKISSPVPPQSSQIANISISSVLRQPKGRKDGKRGSGANSHRRSSNAKAVGDHCEQLVIGYLKAGGQDAIKESVQNVAKNNVGWDIQFEARNGKHVKAEVKGTTAGAMYNFEITENEVAAALEHGDEYWCFLVCDCYKESPKLEILRNPMKISEQNEAELSPTRYRFSLI